MLESDRCRILICLTAYVKDESDMKGRCENVFGKMLYYVLDRKSLDFHRECIDVLPCGRAIAYDGGSAQSQLEFWV